MSNYEKFRKNDIEKSKEMALKINVTQNDINEIEKWFETLLIEHKNVGTFEQQLKTEKQLEIDFINLHSKIETQSNKYILAKLLNYNNIFNSGFLRSTHIPRLTHLLYKNIIPSYFKSIKPKYSIDEFIALSEYLKSNFFVSPNGELLKNALKLEKVNKIFEKATAEQRLKLTENLMNIISEKDFHHDIICFKKILNLINEEDKELITFFKQFKVNNNQGCYSVINGILNTHVHNDLWIDFQNKKELIIFFDATKGAKPNEKWSANFVELNSKVGSQNMKSIANKIIEYSNKRNYFFNETFYWSDDIVKRFIKSAEWITENK